MDADVSSRKSKMGIVVPVLGRGGGGGGERMEEEA